MPNWVRNKVSLDGGKAVLTKLRNFMKTENSEFDFEKLIPMPESLNVSSGSDEIIAKDCALKNPGPIQDRLMNGQILEKYI